MSRRKFLLFIQNRKINLHILCHLSELTEDIRSRFPDDYRRRRSTDANTKYMNHPLPSQPTQTVDSAIISHILRRRHRERLRHRNPLAGYTPIRINFKRYFLRCLAGLKVEFMTCSKRTNQKAKITLLGKAELDHPCYAFYFKIMMEGNECHLPIVFIMHQHYSVSLGQVWKWNKLILYFCHLHSSMAKIKPLAFIFKYILWKSFKSTLLFADTFPFICRYISIAVCFVMIKAVALMVVVAVYNAVLVEWRMDVSQVHGMDFHGVWC